MCVCVQEMIMRVGVSSPWPSLIVHPTPTGLAQNLYMRNLSSSEEKSLIYNYLSQLFFPEMPYDSVSGLSFISIQGLIDFFVICFSWFSFVLVFIISVVSNQSLIASVRAAKR